MSVTMREVAKKAGVSTMTVSRVLSKRGGCSAETRERVEAAAKALGYHVNHVARGLASRRTSTIGLTLPASFNPFFLQMSHVIISEARRRGYTVLLDMRETESDDAEHLRVLQERRVDGILIGDDDVGFQQPSPAARLADRGFPLVMIGRPHTVAIDHVSAKDEEGGYLLTRHLLGLGHRRIAMVIDRSKGIRPIETDPHDRYAGYCQALLEAGVHPDRELVRFGADSPEAVCSTVRSLLEVQPRPTAFFCYNDYTAVAALRALSKAGIRVPDDVAVVGFDDIRLASYACPALTTAAYPWEEIARWAIRLLVDRINSFEHAPGNGSRSASGCQEILLPYSLVVRESCGAGVSEAAEMPLLAGV